MSDALRLAFGTLTALRVPAPRVVDKRIGGRAMTLAPLVGLVLGLLAAGVGALADLADYSPLVVAVLVVIALAVLTRAIHLDGLADTADGLGSGRRGSDALVVMSKSDIGPFGVVTLVLVLLLEVAVLAEVWSDGHGPVAVVIACVASRAALPVLCRRAVTAAKPSGLGAAVASSVGGVALTVSLVVTFLVVGLIGVVDDGTDGVGTAGGALVVSILAALFAGWYCARRFGGITGDVLGAGVELAFLAALLTLA